MSSATSRSATDASAPPGDWPKLPLFSVAQEARRSNKGLAETNLLSLSYGEIVRKSIDASEGLLPESFETYQIVEKDDIVFRFTDLQNDKRSLRSAKSPERGIITSAYVVATPTRVDPRFFAYLMRSYDTQKVFYGMGGGIRQSLRWDDVKRIEIAVPPSDVQRAIADYLDRETARIEALIKKQQELIETLHERKTAQVAHVATKGLRGGVSLRESGLGWIGQIPEHWNILPTKAVLSPTKELVREHWSDTSLLSLTREGVIPRDIESGEGKYPASFEDYQLVEPNDLVFCLFDMDETPRTVGLVRSHGMITGAYSRFRVNAALASPRYLEWYYIAIDDAKRFRPLYTGLRKVIQKPRFLSAGLALPPLNEQEAIADYLEEQAAEANALVARAEEFVVLTKERRSALITAAVTGQIDVQGTING